MANIRLLSSENEIFLVDYLSIVKYSVTIKNLLKNCNVGIGNTTLIPLTNISSVVLRKILEWIDYHKDDPIPPVEPPLDDAASEIGVAERTDDIPQWDMEFLQVNQSTLFEMIIAANYLRIKGLMDVSCKTVANMIKGKSPEEIRNTFNVENDLSDEDWFHGD